MGEGMEGGDRSPEEHSLRLFIQWGRAAAHTRSGAAGEGWGGVWGLQPDFHGAILEDANQAVLGEGAEGVQRVLVVLQGQGILIRLRKSLAARRLAAKFGRTRAGAEDERSCMTDWEVLPAWPMGMQTSSTAPQQCRRRAATSWLASRLSVQHRSL